MGCAGEAFAGAFFVVESIGTGLLRWESLGNKILLVRLTVYHIASANARYIFNAVSGGGREK